MREVSCLVRSCFWTIWRLFWANSAARRIFSHTNADARTPTPASQTPTWTKNKRTQREMRRLPHLEFFAHHPAHLGDKTILNTIIFPRQLKSLCVQCFLLGPSPRASVCDARPFRLAVLHLRFSCCSNICDAEEPARCPGSRLLGASSLVQGQDDVVLKVRDVRAVCVRQTSTDLIKMASYRGRAGL